VKKKEPEGVDPWLRYGGEWADQLVSHPKRRKRQRSTRGLGAGYVDLRLPHAAWVPDLPPPELRIMPAGEPDLPPELLYGSADAVKRKQSQAARKTAHQRHRDFVEDQQEPLRREYDERCAQARHNSPRDPPPTLSSRVIDDMAKEHDKAGYAKNPGGAKKRMRDIIKPRNVGRC
jgi:hypothetical protein